MWQRVPRHSGVPFVLGLFFLFLSSAGAFAQEDDAGFRSLFDGKSLAGWRAGESPESFQVKNGELVVHGPRAHLFYEGQGEGASFRNFVLRAEVKTEKGANSGIFFHTRFQKEGWPRQGYEVQVNSSHADPIRSGSLYGVVKVSKAYSKDGQWFQLEIKVQEKWVTVSVDGRVVVCYREPDGVRGTRRLSRGSFAIQAHDPKSVVHYRKILLRTLIDDRPGLSRAERGPLRPGRGWWERMDYGPFHSCTLSVEGGNIAIKGITAHLSRDERVSMTFDTDLLRMAVGWEGGLVLDGVSYNGSHGPHPRIGGTPVFRSFQGPGVAHRGHWEDPRPIPYGPLPKEWGRWRGLYRRGERSVFSYEVAGRGVLELPASEEVAGQRVLSRNMEIEAGGAELWIALGDYRRQTLSIEDGVAHASAPAPWVAASGPSVVIDRSTRSFDDLAMGAPTSQDLAQGKGIVFRAVPGFAKPHPRAGAVGDQLPRLNDGEFARNSDDTARNCWLDGGSARVSVDLEKSVPIARIDTYSWHRSNRSPQNFLLYGSDAEKADPAAPDLEAAGWKRIAKVDSRPLGMGGRHGSSILAAKGSLGAFRHLLWVLAPSGSEGLFLSEIDLYSVANPPAPLKPRASVDKESWVALVDAPAGVSMSCSAAPGGEGTRLWLKVPAGRRSGPFKVAYSQGPGGEAGVLGVGPPENPRHLIHGGPSLWPEVLEMKAHQGKGKGAYVVDDIPVPFDNPWNSYMRIGGLDFFKDGRRAAVCTWNGDVWIISGLGGKSLGAIKWRRFATGLFETLGLRIVDDLIYVNGRDQITRLHDLDGDGEADFYENFNNQVSVTPNFHEFSFDLQTDAAGDFYLSKAGPVRPGGRGFDAIAPHHGTVMRVAKDGSRREVISTGLRAPNGVGVGPHGELTASDNEGTWVPHCKLHWLSKGSFQGVISTSHRPKKPTSYNPPLCWFPMNVDNSGGGQVWVESDRWGPFEGDLLHLSYGTSSIFKVMKEEVDGVVQGGVFRIPVRLGSSAMRGRFNPADGQLYVCGLRGWQTNAARLSAVQRVRWSGRPVRMPKTLHAIEGGVLLSFTCALDPELAGDVESYAIEAWNYVWGPQYGSPDVSALHPDPKVLAKAQKEEMHKYRVHDKLKLKSATLSTDGHSVFLEIPELRPVMQMHIKVDLESSDGEAVVFDIYNTIHHLARAAGR